MSRNDHLSRCPDEHGAKKIETLRRAIIFLDELMDSLVPECKELSIAKTKLESVRMWAIKGIAVQYPVQEIN